MGNVNSFIFQPKTYDSSLFTTFQATVKDIQGVKVADQCFKSYKDEIEEKIIINIFYSHGNGMDAADCCSKMGILIDNFIDGLAPPCHLLINTRIWEYPGYSINPSSDISNENLYKSALIAWTDFVKDYTDSINICIGSSIGSAFASDLSKLETVDLTILHAPFSKMPEGTTYWYAHKITGTVHDNIKSLDDKHDNLHIGMMYSATDGIMLAEETERLISYCNSFIKMDSAFPYPHKRFFSQDGFAELGNYTAECVRDLRKYEIMSKTIEEIVSSQDHTDIQESETKENTLLTPLLLQTKEKQTEHQS